MDVKTMIEWLKELPPDYDMCFSEYTSIILPEDGKEEEYFVVLDMPIVGMLKNNDDKEVRFFTESSEALVDKQIENGKKWRRLE